MSKERKRIRGSAVIDDEGLFVFTPYGVRSEAEKNMKLQKLTRYGSLWVGKKRVAIRFSMSCEGGRALPPLTVLVAELMELLRSATATVAEEARAARNITIKIKEEGRHEF